MNDPDRVVGAAATGASAVSLRLGALLAKRAGTAACYAQPDEDTARILFVEEAGFADWAASQDVSTRDWISRHAFRGQAGRVVHLPGGRDVIAGVGPGIDRWQVAAIPGQLGSATYRLASGLSDAARLEAAIGWGLGHYNFDIYRDAAPVSARLVLTDLEREEASARVMADAICRDLSNSPAEDMGPAEVEAAVRAVGDLFKAQVSAIAGDALLAEGYTLLHSVGRASPRAPRLIEMRWGEPGHPLVSLVGKGVCFDTGGLDIKTAAGMLDMKYDMGGAAHVIALAAAIMRLALPVRLRVLVPAVDNAIAGNALRPRDIIRARDGTTVEIGNTDAEGRLILAEPLADAAREGPALLIDMATLTGAARVALGPDISALFTRDDALAAEIASAGMQSADPVWRLPLWQPYAANLRGDVADINNIADLNLGSTTEAGAIYAALFLAHFVPSGTAWAHLDILGGTPRSRPGRPRGAVSRGLFALIETIITRFGEPAPAPISPTTTG